MNIFIVGWFGAGNMGDEAILISELLYFKKAVQGINFYILSFDIKRTIELTKDIPEVKGVLMMGAKDNLLKSDFQGIFKAFKSSDYVVIGGGGLFQDIYNYYPIPFFTAISLLTKLLKKRLIFYCLGIGPVKTLISRYLCRLASGMADLITVRDSKSKELLSQIGFKRDVHLYADPVFMLEPVYNENVENISKKYNLNERNSPCIGICVQDLLDWGNKKRKALSGIIESLRDKKGARIFFIPMGRYRNKWFEGDKGEYIDTIASNKLCSSSMGCPYTVIDDDISPQELLAVFEQMDIVISMRLHGIIMAMNRFKPVIAITYKEETKISSLMERIGQEKNLFYISEIDKDRIIDRIEDILSCKEDEGLKIKSAATSLKKDAADCSRLIADYIDGSN